MKVERITRRANNGEKSSDQSVETSTVDEKNWNKVKMRTSKV